MTIQNKFLYLHRINQLKQIIMKVNYKKVSKEISSRINSGEYNNFKSTMDRLQVINKKLLSFEELSKNDVITLKLNGYL